MSYAPLPRSESTAFSAHEEDELYPPLPSPPGLPTHHHPPSHHHRQQNRKRLVIACAVGLFLVAALGGTGHGRRLVAAGGTLLGEDLPLAEAGRARVGQKATAPEPARIRPAPQLRPPTHAANADQPDTSLQSSVTTPEEEPPTAVCTNKPIEVRPLNVHPHPRPPPPCKTEDERYLAYENHSGFHNQGSTLTNALFLAEYLNRTLLLPPARVGMAAPWRPDLNEITEMHESCKSSAIRGKQTTDLPDVCQHKFSDPNAWSYIAWDFVMRPDLLRGRAVVDRWNSSQAWLEAPRSQGGLELLPEEIHSFIPIDTTRRSYQLYELRETEDHLQRAWATRIDLPDLLEAPYADKKLLHFGSLFGNGRIDLATAASWEKRDAIYSSAIIDERLLSEISGEIKERLGTYIGVHLRTGDGTFQWTSRQTFPVIFRKIAVDLLGVPDGEVDRLLEASRKEGDKLGWVKPKPYNGPAHLLERAYPPEEAGEEDEFAARQAGPKRQFNGEVQLRKQAFWPPPQGYTRPLSSSLTCRGQLYPSTSPLFALNQAVYIATDARHPEKMAPFVPFFQHLPCLFLLDDFAKPNAINQGRAVEGLVGMMKGRRKSEWDRMTMAPHLFGFLDAMLAAKGDAMIGTPLSTFSSYAYNVLHKHYVDDWLAAGPPFPSSSSSSSASEGEGAENEPVKAPLPDGGL